MGLKLRYLIVGDMHCVINELEECERLIDFVYRQAIEHDVNKVLFLGDQYNYHNVVHLPVIDFWEKSYLKLTNKFETIVLVGNHDQTDSQNSNQSNAISIHKFISNKLIIVNKFLIDKDNNNIGYSPYYANKDNFIQDNNKNNINLLFCHQTFDGAQFENGFYARDGIDPNLLKAKQVVSGHIHKGSRFGKVWYPGTPRWRSVSDANEQKYLWVVDIDETANIVFHKSINTEQVCTPILSLEDREENSLDLQFIINPKNKYIIDIYGQYEYINKRIKLLNYTNIKIRTHPIINNIKIKESDGISKAFYTYFTEFKPKNGTNKEKLLKMAQEHITWTR